jgi:predicted RNA-binding Zn-ribbon protein involved in translation (DUF1610 family)
MKNTILCTECDAGLMHWDHYFHKYICARCGATKKIKYKCPSCGDTGDEGHLSLDNFSVCTKCGTIYIDQDKLEELKQNGTLVPASSGIQDRSDVLYPAE